MLRYLFSALASLGILCAEEQTSKLYGSWSSDDIATQTYLTSHAVLSEYQKKVLPVLIGRSVITFNPNGTGTMKMSGCKIPKKDGGEFELEATEIRFKFVILGETDSQIVIKSTSENALFSDFPFSILKLHDANTYSVMLSDGITEINGREFFKRVEKHPSEPASTVQPAAGKRSR